MSLRTTTFITDFIVAGCAILALIVVIPAASAASNRIRPGWRAWVWPLVFLSLAGSSICGGFATLAKDNEDAPLVQVTNLLLGLTLHWIILNSFYRVLPDTVARLIAPSVWLGYAIFVVARLFSNSFLAVTIYEIICGAIVAMAYIAAYAKDRDRAADAIPILIGLSLTVLGVLLNTFPFSFDLIILSISNAILFHLLQAVGVIFFMLGGNSSYSVKYAAERRRERERELIQS